MPSPTTRAVRDARPNVIRPQTDEPAGFHFELEPDGRGNQVPTLTYFLTGSECRFTCAFCDLWKYTLERETPRGSLPRQIHTLHDRTRDITPRPKWLKLYNASNFFDPENVPLEDLPRIADACCGRERVIVENHAALLATPRCRSRIHEFSAAIDGQLEVALGLETTDPYALELTNKKLALEQFRSACAWLAEQGVSVRTFVLLQPPGIEPGNAVDSVLQSVQFAAECGVRHCSIVPMRSGNGWLDQLESNQRWSPPVLSTIEEAMRRVFHDEVAARMVITVDLWDRDRFSGGCDHCRRSRYDTLSAMNALQRFEPRPSCPKCDAHREPPHGTVH